MVCRGSESHLRLLQRASLRRLFLAESVTSDETTQRCSSTFAITNILLTYTSLQANSYRISSAVASPIIHSDRSWRPRRLYDDILYRIRKIGRTLPRCATAFDHILGPRQIGLRGRLHPFMSQGVTEAPCLQSVIEDHFQLPPNLRIRPAIPELHYLWKVHQWCGSV